MEKKDEIRKKIIRVRQDMDAEEVTYKSELIVQRISQLPAYQNASTVMGYMDCRNEVRILPLLKKALIEGKRVFVPRCVPEERALLIGEIHDFNTDLDMGHFGIWEPALNKIVSVDSMVLDMVLTPGVIFDFHGHRIGYGAGYYDRFFHSLPYRTLRIGLAFEEQMVPVIPVEDHDVPMDLVITEKKLYRP